MSASRCAIVGSSSHRTSSHKRAIRGACFGFAVHVEIVTRSTFPGPIKATIASAQSDLSHCPRLSVITRPPRSNPASASAARSPDMADSSFGRCGFAS